MININYVVFILSIYICFKLKFVKLDSSEEEYVDEAKIWKGKWFPNKPGEPNDLSSVPFTNKHGVSMGVANELCDNGKINLEVDFDPNSGVNFCLSNKELYTPDYNNEPLIKIFQIPPAYISIHKCMNESISYNERIPTFGTHRPLWPKFGEYSYVPPQRWIHSLEHGAIVALYHPCANIQQIEKLRSIVKNCLWRHIITASELLLPERPFGLIAWGTRMEFSVVYKDLIVNFIQENALKGPEHTLADGQFDTNLVEHATLVSNDGDLNLCPSSKLDIM